VIASLQREHIIFALLPDAALRLDPSEVFDISSNAIGSHAATQARVHYCEYLFSFARSPAVAACTYCTVAVWQDLRLVAWVMLTDREPVNHKIKHCLRLGEGTSTILPSSCLAIWGFSVDIIHAVRQE
jgi:hypothetical protein